ncbi:prolipoprotein diacylglyceryl transferase [bacterium]|nr:prolipoprotein diacylglyceryl transferase [bacterium]
MHDLNPVILQITDKLAIRYYGLAYVLGFVIAFQLLSLFRKHGKSPLKDADQESTALIALIIGTMLGGRLGYMLLYDLGDFIRNPLIFFEFWRGGMASHGGFVGIILAGVWVTKHYKLPPFRLLDVIAPLAPPGILLGRIANFINGELWGRVTTVPWAVIFPDSAPPGTPISRIAPRHPSQLYEAFGEGLVLLVYTQWRMWKSDVVEKYPGQLTGEFLVLYGVVRIIGEQFREPDASLILGMSRGIFYSIFLVIGGAAVIYNARRSGPQAVS